MALAADPRPGGHEPLAVTDAAFAPALLPFPAGTRVDDGITRDGPVLLFPPRAAWLWLPLDASPGLYRLEIAAEGAAALRAEILGDGAPVALPLQTDGGRFGLDFALEAPAAWLRLLPVEAGAVRFTAFSLRPADPWRSLLPDWRLGPVRLPVRQGGPGPSAMAAPAPPSWDPRFAIAAVEGVALDGEVASCGPFGALRLALAAPLGRGHHLVEAEFRNADGSPALVAPRLHADAAAPNDKPLAHFRRRAGARYVARLRLASPATHIVLQPRQERGTVAIAGLTVRRLGLLAQGLSLAAAGWRLFGHRLAAPLDRLLGLDPDRDGPLAALVRLATRADRRYRRSLGRHEGAQLRRLLAAPVRHPGEIGVAIGPGSTADRAATRASLAACGDPAWREVSDPAGAVLTLPAGTRVRPHALAVLRRCALPAPVHTDRVVLGRRSAPHFVAGAPVPLVLAQRPRRAPRPPSRWPGRRPA